MSISITMKCPQNLWSTVATAFIDRHHIERLIQYKHPWSVWISAATAFIDGHHFAQTLTNITP